MKNKLKNSILSLFILSSYFSYAYLAQAIVPDMESITATPMSDEVVLKANINPRGTTTTAWFEYGTSANLINFKETEHEYIGREIYAFPFEKKITELQSETIYYFRLVTDNTEKTRRSDIMSFKTIKNSKPIISKAESNTGLEANALSSSSFFPRTLLGWLIILLVIMCLMLVGRKLYTEIPSKEKDSKVPKNS